MAGAACAGTAYLVGAGPGDPGLITARALALIASADVILYDRLIPPGALDCARPGAQLRYVGKRPGQAAMPQSDIDALLVAEAGAGRSVVRLKGGDPFVFGRGGEEAAALAQAGLAFEVVPGVTAGIAAAAYAGIPVTHRELASGVALVTGHDDPAKDEASIDWRALAAFPGTLVLYMGMSGLAGNTQRLIDAGRPPSEPAAVIENGTTPAQRTVTATLSDIAARVAQAGLRAPAITLVGDVAALRERIAWVERRPLFGHAVVVTRARAQASGLAERLDALGARVVQAPAIRVEPRSLESPEVTRAIAAIERCSLVCVTSVNGAALLMDALGVHGRDARALAGTTVAAVGLATVAELRLRGIEADMVPERSTSDALAQALATVAVEGRAALVVRPATASEQPARALRERGAEVDELVLYETVAQPLDAARAEAVAAADYVTFTSSSTVRFLVDALGGAGPLAGARIASIGPATSATAREHGLEVHVEADRHDVDGLVDALVADAAR